MSGAQAGPDYQQPSAPPPHRGHSDHGSDTGGGRASPPPGRIGPGRHVASVVLGLVLTPLALMLFEYALVRRNLQAAKVQLRGDMDDGALLAVVAGSVLVLVAAALGRMSPLGPLVSGCVWGVLPWVMVTFFLEAYWSFVRHLPRVFEHQVMGMGWNLGGSGFVLYAAVGAPLLGAGVAAAWRGRPRSR